MDDKDLDIKDITIDLGSDHISGGSSVDTITLNSSWDSIGTIDMSTYNSTYNTYTLPVSTTSGSSYTISNGTWSTTPYITTTTNPGISVEGDAEFKGNIKVKGKDLSEWMETLERRLAILVPDPKKLEQYEALQKAYKHYKMLEALCEERKDEDESK
jgi:hypothetical protein